MAVSKRLRYEILRRDNHACRYCGATAPDAKLTVDHVTPVALGGDDSPTNLVAACAACNAGKSASSPDAPLVADIEQKAVMWRRAIAVAAERRRAEFKRTQELLAAFQADWDTAGSPMPPLGPDWRETVPQFLALGLSVQELLHAIDIAHAANIANGQVWKYFCGVCWNKVRALEADARKIMEELDGA